MQNTEKNDALQNDIEHQKIREPLKEYVALRAAFIKEYNLDWPEWNLA